MKKLLTLWRAENSRIDFTTENLIMSPDCNERDLAYIDMGASYPHDIDGGLTRVEKREQIVEPKQSDNRPQLDNHACVENHAHTNTPTHIDNRVHNDASAHIDKYEDLAHADVDTNTYRAPGSYFGTSALIHAKRRITWLIVLMLSATLTGLIISNYEDQIAAVPMLVTFIPMIMDTSGNCGSQSSTLIIRGVALDEIHPRDWMRVLIKELSVGLLVGVALAVVNAVRVFIQYHGEAQALGITLTVSLTLIGAVVCAKLIGSLLPLVAVRLKLDPALMASPLITTIADTISILLYFKIALSILKI